MAEKDWSDEEIDILKRMLERNCSCSEIGNKLGRSRNSVAGKINRLNLRGSRPKKRIIKAKPFNPKTKIVKPAVAKVETVKSKPAKSKPAKIRRKRLRLKTENLYKDTTINNSPNIERIPTLHQCKFIYGDPKDKDNARWCRKPTFGETSWCKDHLKKIYVPGTAFNTRKKKKT